MSRNRRRFLVRHGVTVLVVILGFGLTMVEVRSRSDLSRREAGEIMDRMELFVVEEVRRSVEATRADAAGAAGLFLASEEVTEAEFGIFAASVGRQEGNLGLAYIPVVPASEMSAFLERVHEDDPTYKLFTFDPVGEGSPSESVEVHYPVLYLAPGSDSDLDLRGFDALSDSVWMDALRRAAERGGVSVSPLTPLFGRPDLTGFLMVAPIVESGRATGFAVSMARVDGLVDGKLAASLSEVVDWRVTDAIATPPQLDSPATDPLHRTQTLQVVDRLWQVEVTPTELAGRSLTGSPTWADVALGLLLTVAAAISAHIGVEAFRSREENARLRRLAEEKDEFMAAISHELRTPLTVVVGMGEILEETTLGSDPEVREYVSMLRQQGTELARLVDNLLLLGRLDAEVLPMRPESVDLAWEVERIIREVEVPNHLEVSLRGTAEVWADPLRLRHVIRHLHTNAIHHANSHLWYEIGDGPGEVRLAVADDGPGVASADLPTLFVAASGTKETPGSPTSLGLGLRVSKRLAIALGGDLTYHRSGSQTIFELRLIKAPIGEPAEFATSADARQARNRIRS